MSKPFELIMEDTKQRWAAFKKMLETLVKRKHLDGRIGNNPKKSQII